MSSAYVKGRLKAAREQIAAKDWDKAASTARDALSFEASNYNALVFLAVALSNLGKIDESEELYLRAFDEHPELPLAERGLLKLYEDSEQWDKLSALLERLMDRARDQNDAMKLAEHFQKLLGIRRSRATPSEIAATLELLLPNSPYYDVLSSLPDPEPTSPSPVHAIQLLMQNSLPALEEVVAIVEQREAQSIAQETDKRRMRLTGKVLSAEETKKSVQCDFMGASKLPALYSQILGHPYASDALRRFTEAKLLSHFYSYLISIPVEDESSPQVQAGQDTKAIQARQRTKKKLRERTVTLASDMVLLKVPDRLAWSIKLNWQDVDGVADYELYDLRNLVAIFPPEEPLAKLAQVLIPAPSPTDTDDKSANDAPKTDHSAFVMEGLEALPDSLFAHTVAAQHYLSIKDLHSLRNVCEAGLQILQFVHGQTGQPLPKTQKLLDCQLAFAYVHVDSPIHHRKALRLLDQVLQTDAENTLALLSKAYILSQAESWSAAMEIFDRLLASEAASEEHKLESRGERAWCLVGLGRLEEAETELEAVLDILYQQSVDNEDLLESLKEAKGRTWWRLGRCFWARGGDHRELPEFAYTSFTESIRICPTFAPSFTWLGKHYLQISSDKEQAIRLFQKALDLDANEHEAGQLLAELHAQAEEWTAVEMVARRIVSLLAASSSTETALSGTLILKKYAWAWRAIGMADIKAGRFESALTALQRTLRGEPDDATAWLQLGIAYRGAGKHIASLKAFGRVVELAPEDWSAFYLAGDIQRSIGLLDASLNSFDKVLDLRPNDLGIRVVLCETLLLQARSYLQNGMVDRAIDSLLHTARSALDIIEGQVGATAASKILADSFSDLASVSIPEDDIGRTLGQILKSARHVFESEDLDGRLPDIASGFSPAFHLDADITTPQNLAYVTVLAFKLKLLYEPADSATQATAWADLGISVFHHRLALTAVRPEFQEDEILRWSVHCLREALRSEPRNPVFWNALGTVAFNLSPRLAQHSFIRAAEYNQRSAIPWTHLGIFYLFQQQPDLANKSFLKAQVLDPEWPNAWLGQACLAALYGEERERRALITHAWMLASGSVPLADLEYAKLAMCEQLPHAEQPSDASASQAIQRYLAQRTADPSARYLSGILLERLRWPAAASVAFAEAAGAFEAKYESSESDMDAKAFTQAKLAEGRALLAAGQFKESIEALEVSDNLLGEPSKDDIDIKLEGLLHLGLAQWSGGHQEQGLETLSRARELAADQSASAWGWRLALASARSLWSTGEADNKATANDLLLGSINDPETNAPNLEVITTLAAFAILDKDEDLLEAAISELQDLPASRRTELDANGDVAHLLAVHHLLRGTPEAAIEVLERALFAAPSDLRLRKDLASLLISVHRKVDARQLIASASTSGLIDPELVQLQVEAAAEDDPDVERIRQLARYLDPVANAI